MKRIAILTCLKACQVCTGAACLSAWNQRSRGFARYQGEEVQLSAFLHCNGCATSPLEDAGMREKLDRLVSLEGPFAVLFEILATHRLPRQHPLEYGCRQYPFLSRISLLFALTTGLNSAITQIGRKYIGIQKTSGKFTIF